MFSCSLNDERLAYMAQKEAVKSSLPMKHGCIAVSGGKIIARGYNNYRIHSKDKIISNCCSCHAEMDVLRKCIKRNINKKINLYIVRVSDDGTYRNSAPCNRCINVLKKYKIRMIIYSNCYGNLEKHKLVNYKNYHETGGEKAIINNRITVKKRGSYIVYKNFIDNK